MPFTAEAACDPGHMVHVARCVDWGRHDALAQGEYAAAFGAEADPGFFAGFARCGLTMARVGKAPHSWRRQEKASSSFLKKRTEKLFSI
jgi:hypothetical protein